MSEHYFHLKPDNQVAVFILLLILVAIGFIGKISPRVPTIPLP